MVGFRNILCPVDFSACSELALDYALALAREKGGQVSVMHVLPNVMADPDVYPYLAEPVLTSGETRERAYAQLGNFVSRALAQNVACDVVLESGAGWVPFWLWWLDELYERLGLCGPGEGPRLIDDGITTLRGRVPVNPSGGLCSRGHPVGATGLLQIAELVWQMRGEAGERQIEARPKVALAQNQGGLLLGQDSAVYSCTILKT